MPAYARTLATVAVLAVIVGSIAFLEANRPGHAPVSDGSANVSVATSTGNSLVATTSTAAQAARIAEKKKEFETAKELVDPTGFVNTDPFTIQSLIGKKVILVDFWTYSCINCIRTLPYVESWYRKYKSDGFVVIGVHTPEFDFEKNIDNVRQAVEKFGVTYPVVLDSNYGTWGAYGNNYWPHEYLIDIDGFIAEDHIGEGGYDATEAEIVKLLNERKQVLGETGVIAMKTGVPSVGAPSPNQTISPETYLGANRLEYLANLPSPSCVSTACSYSFSDANGWQGYQLSGMWTITPEYAELPKTPGSIRLNFSADKVHFVAGAPGGSIRAKILLDGEPITTANAGADVKNGIVTISMQELYTLVDFHGSYETHILEIQFLDPGVQAFTFTFG